MEIRERIAYILKHEKISASLFADKIGVQRSSISHVLSGRNKPSLDYLQKILQNFSLYNAEWLVMGIGEPIKGHIEPKQDLFSPSATKQLDNPIATNVNTNRDDNTVQTANAASIEEPNPLANIDVPIIANSLNKTIDKIVILYTDGTFKAYNQ